MEPSMPVNEQALASHADDPAYIALGNLLFGSDSSQVPLTLRSPSGAVRDVTVSTGEQHIDRAAEAIGVRAKWLSFVDLLHVLAYPFLLWAAWLLHRRNARDVVSSILSLAVLLTIAAEQPSSAFLASAGVPRGVNVAIYDLGNVLLLAGIALFPHGNLSWRTAALLAALPLLFLLQGATYQALFVAFMLAAVLMLVGCLRRSPSSDQRQQIRWALLGISGYALLRCISIAADVMKWSTGSFGQQLIVEIMAGVSFAIAVVLLELGLLVALLRYRLYDAEIAISRSANFAVITLAVAAIFAALADALKQIVYNYYGNSNGEGPVVIAAAVATVLVNPIQDRIQRWSERRFQKNLFLLRDDLPELVRDMRETASLDEMLDEILVQVERGVRAVRAALIVGDGVVQARGAPVEEVQSWRQSVAAKHFMADICEASDRIFPIRVPLVPSSADEAPVGYLLVGPRPDGSIPSRDEQKALAGVAEPIARAIRTVVKRQQREAEVAALITSNDRRIERLESLLQTNGAQRRSKPRPRPA
jgi:hypothetical protein